MKTNRASRHSGFSLIELIGVLAIIAVLASAVAPNAIKSLDRAAIRAEVATLDQLGDQLSLFVRDTGAPPVVSTWAAQLASYVDLAPSDLSVNRRNNTRVFLADPATNPAQRVMILSSMRSGLALPTAGNINTAARFDDLWQTGDGIVPSTTSWNGWGNWANTADSGDYLVIERINLVPVYRGELLPLTIALNNTSGVTASYGIVPASGASPSVVNVAAGASVTLTNLRSRDRINLFRSSGGVTLDYTYVLSNTGKTFDFDGAKWSPQ